MRKWYFIFILIVGLAACADDKDVLAPVPNDVTLNELSLERFTHIIPDGGFTSKAAHKNSVTFNTKKNNDGTYAGFAYSNRNNRSINKRIKWKLIKEMGNRYLTDNKRYA